MNEREHRQVTLIIEDELALSGDALERAIETVYALHSAKGRLRSGATLREVIAVSETAATSLLELLVTKIEKVAADPESFEMISTALLNFADMINGHVPRLLDVVGRKEPSTKAAVHNLLREMSDRLDRKVEINRYKFEAVAQPKDALTPSPHAETTPKKGGRPLADHWSAMWAATAFALHAGELNPKRQAHIEQFMLDWLAANNLNGNLSTVRGHARKLWALIEADSI